MTGASRENRAILAIGKKICSRCGVLKLHSEFYTRGDGKYVTSLCIVCSKEYYIENKEHIREMRRKQRLGVPSGTYEYLVGVYGNQCGICGTTEPVGTGAKDRQFSIDHDERTGLIRGLLCTNCNVGIGMLQHRISLLKKAAMYLSREGQSVEEICLAVGKDSVDMSELLGDEE